MSDRGSFLMQRFGLAALLGALAAPGALASARTTLWLDRTSCEPCAVQIEAALESVEGVTQARVDLGEGQAVIEHAEDLSAERLISAVVRAGYRAGTERARLREPDLLEGFDPATDVKVVVYAGEEVDLARSLAERKVTVIDFFATWCLPCRAVERRLQELLKAETEIAVRRVNVVDWSTPIAKRYFKDGVVLPYLHIYNRSGKLIAELSGPSTREVEQIARKALRSP